MSAYGRMLRTSNKFAELWVVGYRSRGQTSATAIDRLVGFPGPVWTLVEPTTPDAANGDLELDFFQGCPLQRM